MLDANQIEREVQPILQSNKRNFLLRFLELSLSGASFGKKGKGSEFYSLREYLPGQDDYRHIDWKSSARLQKTFAREQQSEKSLNVCLLLDSSGSMQQKKKYLCQLVYLFSQLFTESNLLNEGLSLIWGAQAMEGYLKIPSKKGIARQVLEQAIEIPLAGQSDLTHLLLSAQEALKRRSLVLLLTDLIDAQKWLPSLSALCQKHTVLITHLSAMIDHALPALGYSYLKDPENGELLFVDCSSPELQQSYQQLSVKRSKETYEYFYGLNSRLKLWKIDTDKPLSESIDELF